MNRDSKPFIKEGIQNWIQLEKLRRMNLMFLMIQNFSRVIPKIMKGEKGGPSWSLAFIVSLVFGFLSGFLNFHATAFRHEFLSKIHI
jgi:hypothetical protein